MGVLLTRAVRFGVYTWSPDFWKRTYVKRWAKAAKTSEKEPEKTHTFGAQVEGLLRVISLCKSISAACPSTSLLLSALEAFGAHCVGNRPER